MKYDRPKCSGYLPPTVNYHICVQGKPTIASPNWDTHHIDLREVNSGCFNYKSYPDAQIGLNANMNLKREYLLDYLECQIQKVSQGCLGNYIHRSCSSRQ